jgi:hypothetical protein
MALIKGAFGEQRMALKNGKVLAPRYQRHYRRQAVPHFQNRAPPIVMGASA